MAQKTILGLDLGTNSIGWSLINHDSENRKGKIIDLGTRIIPMSQDILGEFEKGNSISQTAVRTQKRMARRIRERFLLRRERLHRVLNILGYLPTHYADQIDFEKYFGKFKKGTEPKLSYKERDFIFKKSFEEMLLDFKYNQPELLINEKGEKRQIPYDWTIYYLRKKALTRKIEKEELTWLLLHFNQKRGYYQLRGEEEGDNSGKQTEFCSLKIIDVIADEAENGKQEKWYTLVLENGWRYRRSSKFPLFDWKNKTRDFIVTTELNEFGQPKLDKEGNEKRSFRAPNENDWTLKKKKTEFDINISCKTIGTYIYDNLLLNPSIKIKGKLIQTIERHYYKNEIEQILEEQSKYHKELSDTKLYNKSILELYPQNISHRKLLQAKDFRYLFINDIIFYQRPLKSKKSTVGLCSFEFRPMKDKKGVLQKDVNGKQITRALKAIAKSNPIYQEFRIWKWLHDLSIYKKDTEQDVTVDFIKSGNDKEALFDFLNNRKEIDQKALIKYLLEKNGLKGRTLTSEIQNYRWNYVEDKTYPCNETLSIIRLRLEKVANLPDDFISKETITNLCHIMYSVKDKLEYEKALKTYAIKNKLDLDSFFEAFRKSAPFENDYGAYSEKAIKKLLPLMRVGKYWSQAHIDRKTQKRIENIITGEYDESIKDRVREKAVSLTEFNQFQGLQEWLVKYIVYDRHSEAALINKWESSEELNQYLKEFKQHSLRNPIVEQVITESLRVVKDIWNIYGGGAANFFDEIHVELGRDMKNPADDRKRMAAQMAENENTNLRIKSLLAEMLHYDDVENVRPYSPVQQEILKIYEEGALNAEAEIDETIIKISKTAQPTSAELKKYKLWLEQKYRSPYTGEIIPLNKLFTPAYEIEHIIPKDRYFDDSFNNKVICEAAVNKLKSNKTGLEFINKHHGEIVQTGLGKSVRIFEPNEYEHFVKKYYNRNRSKRLKLLMEEIPEKMIERQINDTRYISRFIANILSNIVREEKQDDGINSKNLIAVNGKITSTLKQDWGLNDIWNDLILPRFERINSLTGTTHYTTWNENHQKFIPTIPIEQSKYFSKKRIDHRHHALDALIVACATRDHINYMNNESALRNGKSLEEKIGFRHDLRNKLCEKVYNKGSKTDYSWKFKKPWPTISQESKSALSEILISFKQNLRIINKTNNRYLRWTEDDGKLSKQLFNQKNTNWAIRKPLHKEFIYGKVQLKHIKTPAGKILTAKRNQIDITIGLESINSITDTGIQKILTNYLKEKGSNPEIAFSAEGLEELNRNIRKYNDGKNHKPIYKARFFEIGSRFQLGVSGNNMSKYVEAAKGTNLFYAVYLNEDGKRVFETIPLILVIERQKQGLTPVPEYNDKGNKLLFYLSPDDLVYVPTEDEMQNQNFLFTNLTNSQKERLYNVNDFSSTCYFRPNRISKAIIPKEIDMQFDVKKNKLTGSFDTKTTSFKGVQIKDICIKIGINRLGKIIPVL